MKSLARYARQAAIGAAVIASAGAAAALWSFRGTIRAAVGSHPYFAVREISVQGAERYVSESAVLAWLDIAPGVSVWDVSPARTRARLEAHPFVARAVVHREFPDRLSIEVRERRPQALVLLDRLYYLDRTGTVFGPLAERNGRDYPVITGMDEHVPAGKRAVVLRRLSRLSRLCARRECFGGVSEIHLDARLDVVLHPRSPRVPVVLGWGSWPEKIDRAERALAQWEGEVERLAAVDVRFRNQVVMKPGDAEESDGPRSQRPDENDRGTWGLGEKGWFSDQPPAASPQPRSALRTAAGPWRSSAARMRG